MRCSQSRTKTMIFTLAFAVFAAAVVANQPDAITSTAEPSLTPIPPGGFNCQPFPTLSGEGETICRCRSHLRVPCTFWSSRGASRPKGHKSCDHSRGTSTSHVASCHAANVQLLQMSHKRCMLNMLGATVACDTQFPAR
jgi:hypothetical protein